MPELAGTLDTLYVGTMYRAGSGASIELGDFTTTADGKLQVYFQPNGDSDRGVNISVPSHNISVDCAKSGAKIGNARPGYVAEIDLPAGSYFAGDVVITLITNTSNIFGVNIENLANNTSGTCGENLTWTLADGTLTISGTGAMADYSYATAPWYFNRGNIKTIIIENDVTSIGNRAFSGCSKLTAVVWNAANCADFSSSKYAPFYDSRANITSFTFGENVEHIPAYLCYDMSKLTQITIPNSVTSIGSSAFSGCSALTAVYYTGDVAGWCDITFGSYDANPLYYAGNLYINNELVKELVIPNSVTEIKYDAFCGCRSFTQVTIPNSVTSIGNFAFSGCTGLTGMTVLALTPPAIESHTFQNVSRDIFVRVPGEALNDYKADLYWGNLFIVPLDGKCGDNLTWMYAGDTLTISGTGDMYDYNESSPAGWNDYIAIMGTIVLQGGITGIGTYAFSNCSSLTQITIPNSVTSIGDYAFEDCSALKRVTIPESVTSIGEWAFSGCYKLTAVYYTGDVAGWCGITFDGSPANPLYYAGNLYINNELVTNLIIPNSVTEIKDYAFYGCRSFTRVTIPEGVTNIGRLVFNDCSALTTVVWNAANCADFSIWEYDPPFYDSRANITSFTFGENVEHIPAYLCYGLSKLKQVTIPESVTSIGRGAFCNCSSLKEITIPNSITSIEIGVFYGCTSLTQIAIPSSVTSIGNEAFYNCSSLTQITIPNSITSIEIGVFYGCTSLTQITIPDGVTSIGSSAFESCVALTSFIIPDNVTSIGAKAFSGSGIVSLAIPVKANEFGTGAFEGCNKLATIFYRGNIAEWCSINFADSCANPLASAPETVNLHIDNKRITELTIPEGVTTINDYSFCNAAFLTFLDIPESVTNIGEKTFAGCTALDSIYCRAAIPPTITATTFNEVDRAIPLYIPEDKTMDYMFASYWNEFTNLQTISTTALHAPSMPESIRIVGGTLHNPQGLPVSIVDLQGRVVYSGTATAVSQPAGVYVVRCAGASRKVLF